MFSMQDPLSEWNHQFLETAMASGDLVIGMVFLWQTIIGFLGNFFLLFHNFLYLTRCPVRPKDLILKHLTLANFLVIFCKGVPQTMSAFGATHFLSDTGCKLVFYVHRVGRGVGTGITCLLSIFQAITISPRNFRWEEMKPQASRYMGPSNILCWMLNMLLNISVPMYVGKWNSKNTTNKIDYGYCSAVIDNRVTGVLLIALLSSYDVLCLGLMVWTSSFIVLILYKHKQQVRHLHSATLSPRSSPETRITQSILVLVGTFVSFYTLSCIFSLFLARLNDPGWWLVNSSALITACFPTVSPFVLRSRDPRISRLIFACCRGSMLSSK
ncbi:vomeronasal type-1 receptor 4-like [Marmota marmota marmota]|uniref:vomeronasal type-1 receptor 4-like n=1 Tax=Marmota marmota marmota TaxID=9994 RepID=UPI002093BDD5|nr:vomeronasal type-1 receptor 4-like [Marmota marmota marmota]